VFTYRCPGCGKQHSENGPFEQAFEAKCLRCARTFPVTQDAIQGLSQAGKGEQRTQAATTKAPGKRSQAITKGPISAPVPPETRESDESAPIPPETRESDEPEESGADQEEALALVPLEGEQPPRKRKNSAGKGKRKAVTPTPLADEEEEAKPEPPAESKEDEADQPLYLNRWVLIVALSVLVLFVGGGGFLFFGRAPAKKVAVKKDRPPAKVEPEVEEEEKKEPEKKEKDPEPAKTPPPTEVRISAPRLAAEQLADPAGTIARYRNRVIEVSGLFNKVEPVVISVEEATEIKPPAGKEPAKDRKAPPEKAPAKDKKAPAEKASGKENPFGPQLVPVLWRVLFLTEVGEVHGEISAAPKDITRWRAIHRGNRVTVRAVYGKDGILRDCALLRYTPAADGLYRGQGLEVTGVVDAVEPKGREDVEFPLVLLERETSAKLAVRCLFPRANGEELTKLKPGMTVAVKGTCSGRWSDSDFNSFVRVDNCRLIDTTAPEGKTVRLDARDLARAYEEDLKSHFLPERGKEERIEAPLSVPQLAVEFARDPKSLDKYRNKVITLLSSPGRKVPSRGLLLESPQTDHTLKVLCRFERNVYALLDENTDLPIRGLCTGMENTQTLRIDNCELVVPPSAKNALRLTADFLPHKKGTVLTYDLALHSPSPKQFPTVVRQLCSQEDEGVTATVITHTYNGALPERSLLKEEKPGSWILSLRVKKGQLPAPPTYRRLTGGFVEVGQLAVTGPKKTEIMWEPVLKIGARVGDSWEWTQPTVKHRYTLLRFEEYREQPSAVIGETVLSVLEGRVFREIRRVYVRGLGEVERREVALQIGKEEQLVSEKRLVVVEELQTPPRVGKDKLPKSAGDRQADERETIPPPREVK
jgi:hypothetical protein